MGHNCHGESFDNAQDKSGESCHGEEGIIKVTLC